MSKKLFEKKNRIEHEIFVIECVDRLSHSDKEKLRILNKELLNLKFQIEREKIK